MKKPTDKSKPWEIPLTSGHRLGCQCHNCLRVAKHRREKHEEEMWEYEDEEINQPETSSASALTPAPAEVWGPSILAQAWKPFRWVQEFRQALAGRGGFF